MAKDVVQQPKKVSLFKLRIGVVMFILWWIPIYLTVPAINAALGITGNAKADERVFIFIIVAQTIVGFIGLILVGKELTFTLKRVKYKKLPATMGRMIWSGDTHIAEADLKQSKKKNKTAAAKTAVAKDAPVGPINLTKTLLSKPYLTMLVFAIIIGIPISAIAYYFLYFIDHLQNWTFNVVPSDLGFHGTPIWWVIIPLLFASFFVSLTIKYLPGKGGHVPADGFSAGGHPLPPELPGLLLAAIASIGLGAVIGPEAPLIAIGGGLGYLAIKLVKRDVSNQGAAIVAATGSFAAISTLLGSPLIAAFLLFEASGLGGDAATIALLPGLLGAGIGTLIFIGLGSLTGHGTFSLAIPQLPSFAHPNIAMFGWAIVIGIIAAVLGVIIKKFGLIIKGFASKKIIITVFAAGILIAVLAMVYAQISGHNTSDVLFSGQSALPYFIDHASEFSVGAILLLILTKGIAYGLSLGSFRGGPIFPSMFIGAILGIAMSHLPGLPLVPAVAMGIGAMTVSILRLPFTAVLLATLLLASDGLAVMPLAIVAVVVSFIVSTKLLPKPAATAQSASE